MTAPRYRSVWAVPPEVSERPGFDETEREVLPTDPVAPPAEEAAEIYKGTPDTPERLATMARAEAAWERLGGRPTPKKRMGRPPKLPLGDLNIQLRKAILREEKLRGISTLALSRFTGVQRTSLRRYLQGEGLTLRSFDLLVKKLKWVVTVVDQEGKVIARTGRTDD